MIKWLKRNQNPLAQSESNDIVDKCVEQRVNESVDEALSPTKTGFFSKFKQGLSKTRQQLGDGLSRLLHGKKEIDAELVDELEMLLIAADLGVDTTKRVLSELTDDLARQQLADGPAIYNALKMRLQQIFVNNNGCESLALDKMPLVILMVGVNGAGKTTTIGKLARQYQQLGKTVMLAAGDTFRAAAVEQLQAWGERNNIPVIAQHTGADSASVIFDAFQAAKARGIDILIADTAGRLHTQNNLMDELKKIKRVMQKMDGNAPHETMLVLDASIGQNALNQAKQFHDAIGVTGITMTKLDGTAKGGILFAIAHELKVPFRYLGLGEGIDDLRPFEAEQFVNAIFNDDRI